MEISATISYLPVRDSLARAGVAVDNRDGGQSRQNARASQNNPANALASNVTKLDTAASADVAARNAQAVREDSLIGRNAASQPVQEPAPDAGLRFEYENKTQVMKVNDNKGILIYQVPSKGQLQLIEAQDSSELPRIAQTA